MARIIEAVPNFSEGRDRSFVEAVVRTYANAGAEVLDASMDPDHHRSVVTVIGPPEDVAEGSVAVAELALDRIDLRQHRGVHPRIGALDVLPFVPLVGIDTGDVVALARQVGDRIAGLGVPVHYYGAASDPPGRPLYALRRGGFEALSARDRAAHPTAGATCVGVRRVLLAWNVDVAGVPLTVLREIASELRERGGGFPGLRTLALALPRQDRLQLSMNLEDPVRTDPLDVFQALEKQVLRHRGRVVETEVIGMLPDALATPEAASRMRLREWREHRVLSRRVAAYVSDRPRAHGQTTQR